MISVVCVYNDARCLDACLRPSLAGQSARHQFLPVDNRDGRFSSAPAALNWGAARADGDWVLFAHQDVRLIGADWLARAEAMLGGLGPAVGWAGVIGRSADNAVRGLLIDRAMLFGTPFPAPEPTQTLDECVLLHRRVGAGPYFDEGLASWHAYGVDACCRALREGRRNYVLPLLVHHDSRSTNLARLDEAHEYVRRKHGAALGPIATSCGVISGSPPRGRGHVRRGWAAAVKRVRSAAARVAGFRTRFAAHGGEVVEELFAAAPEVHVWHAPAPIGPIEVAGFAPNPGTARRVIHHFAGAGSPPAGAVCAAPDLVEATPDAPDLPAEWTAAARLVVWTSPGTLADRPGLRRALARRASDRVVVRNWSDPDAVEFVYALTNR